MRTTSRKDGDREKDCRALPTLESVCTLLVVPHGQFVIPNVSLSAVCLLGRSRFEPFVSVGLSGNDGCWYEPN